MSEENLEIVRRHMVAYLSGDFETALSTYHPQVVLDATARPEGSTFHGHEGVAEAMRVWRGTWDEWTGEVDELIDAGEKVLMVLRESGRGKGSGVDVAQHTYFLLTLEDGQIVRSEIFIDKHQALEAAGLSE